MKLSPNAFLFLSALGFGLLWGVMASNGTLDALNKAQADGIYPGGRPLRIVYTGFKSLDGAITMLVVFFDILCSGENPGSRLLGIDLIGVVHCINVWNFVDARRRGVQTEWMRHPLPWIIAWNSLGVAVVLPLYCYCICLSGATKRDHTIPLNEARALVPISVIGYFFPLLMFGPAFLNWEPYHQHGYIAHYFWAAPVVSVMVLVLASLPGPTSKKDPRNPDLDSYLVSMSYMLAGVYAAAIHMYTIYVSLSSSDPDLSLSRLFIPSPGKVGGSQSGILVEGVHLFTQFDWHIVAITCLLFAYYQVERGTKVHAPVASLLQTGAEWETLLVTGLLGTSGVIFGPGAAASFGLAIREQSLRAAAQPAKCQ